MEITFERLSMSLSEILIKRRSELVQCWVDSVMESYPADTARFLKAKKDRFLNPVGHTIKSELGAIFDALASGGDWNQEERQCLDRLIRIRALQNFTASSALSFIFGLKHILRQELSKELEYGKMAAEMLELDTAVDRLGLMAFDIYVGCREQICELKSRDMRNQYAAAIKRAGIEFETPDRDKS